MQNKYIHFCSIYSVGFMQHVIQKAELGYRSDSPRCVLQGAPDFTHLLFPKIHHGQMYSAILTHTDFPVHKGWDIRDESFM